MSKLSNCLSSVQSLHDNDAKAIGDALDRLVAKGVPVEEAQVQAIQEVIAGLEARLQERGRPNSDGADSPLPPVSSNTLVSDERAEELRAKLRSRLGRLNTGFDPELLAIGAELAAYHIEKGVRTFTAFAKTMVEQLGSDLETLKPYLRGWYNGARDMLEDSGRDISGMDDSEKVRDTLKTLFEEQGNAEHSDGRATGSVANRTDGDAAEGDLSGEGRGAVGRDGAEAGREGWHDGIDGKDGLSTGQPPVSGTEGRGRRRSQESDAERVATGNTDDQRSAGDGADGLHVEREPAAAAGRVVEKADDVADRTGPGASDDKPTTADVAEIKQQMPFLSTGQAEDVAFAERRFAELGAEAGVLFTNGTGTGKTFTGLGIVRRLINAGKGNVLIAVPKQTIADAWIKAAADFFNIQIKLLDSTKDNGKSGVVITTYANMGDNNSLVEREWDAFVMDESHYLSSNADGDTTKALKALNALAKQDVLQRVSMRMADTIAERKEIEAQLGELRKPGAGRDTDHANQVRGLQAKADALAAKIRAAQEAEKSEIAKLDKSSLPKGVFLSATPFAYEKTVRWAQGWLFNWGNDQDGAGYNSGNNYDRFMMQHFGYRMRYNKLTEPDSKVDRGLMQRAFNGFLKRSGALSARALDSEFDYDRLFVLSENAIGRRVDEALDWLREKSYGAGSITGMREVADSIEAAFKGNARYYFLEALKARDAIPHIKAHLALGRQVVVMHDYKKGGASNPFRLSMQDVEHDTAQAYDAFKAEFDDLIRDFDYIPSPITTLTNAFPEALIYNGDFSPKQRLKMESAFNSDADDSPRLMIAQGDAMREGVSIHDRTGKFSRVLVHIGVPNKPTAAIQQEGRIYRTGQASDAMFRYLTIGTAWERSAFADKIAGRASAAENLAMGEGARGLKQAFIDAYENADAFAPGFDGEGKGGKENDKAMSSALTPWDQAISYYYGTKKQGSGRSSNGREGKDYFATPEPVGMKMVEWANIRTGDDVLEPSAGHGAIAQWFPDGAKVRVIEPSKELASRLALRVDGDVVNSDFESHNIVNKYDAIVMNPPYGAGGKLAVEHLAKAATHLREGGRVVALIPTGPSADKHFERWLYAQDDKGRSEHPDLHLIRSVGLPRVTFERAGTSVATRIVVIEKVADKELAGKISQRQPVEIQADTIADLFDKIRDMDMPERVTPVEEESGSVEVAQAIAKPASSEATPVANGNLPIVTYTTKAGKELRGVVRNDLTKDQAKSIDPYTWELKRGEGWFIREKHFKEMLERFPNDVAPLASIVQSESTDPGSIVKNRFESALADVKRARNAFKRLGSDIQIVREFDDLPSDLSRKILRSGGLDVEGLYDPATNKVWLIHDNIRSQRRLAEVIAHEVVGHYAMENMLGKDLMARLTDHVIAMDEDGNPRISGLGKIVDQRQPGLNARNRAKEIIALMAETGQHTKAPIWQRVVGKIREWLMSVGLTRNIIKQLNDKDVLRLLRQADAFARGKRSGAPFIPVAPARGGEAVDSVLASNPDTLFSRQLKWGDDITPGQAEALKKIGVTTTDNWKNRWNLLRDNMGLKIQQGLADRFASLKRLDELAYGKDKLDKEAQLSSWMRAHLSMASEGALEAMFLHGRLKLTDGALDTDTAQKGLVEVLRPLGGEVDRFFAWIAGRRAAELKAQGRENLFTDEDISNLSTLNHGKMEGNKNRTLVYANAHAQFRQFQKSILDIAEQAGIINGEERATWESDFYVPFYRVLEDDDKVKGPRMMNGLTNQKGIKRLKGGTGNLNDLLANSLMNWQHMISASMRNLAAKQALENAARLGVVEQTAADGKGTVFVLENGQKRHYLVHDPLLLEGISAISRLETNGLIFQAMGGLKRLLTWGVTISPEFRIANLLRDSISSIGTTGLGKNPLANIKKGYQLTKESSVTNARMLAGGGQFNQGQLMNGVDTGATGARQMLIDHGIGGKSGLRKTRDFMLWVYDKWQDFGSRLENVNRAALYDKVLAESGSHLKASFEARDLLNFTSHGNWQSIRFLIRVVPFLNARIQGLYKLGRAGMNPKQRMALGLTMLSCLAVGLALTMAYRDDEDFKRREEFDRDTYWWFRIGDTAIKIPKPFEIGAIATVIERAIEWGIYQDEDGGKRVANSFMSTVLNTFSFNPLPQAIRPAIEVGFNENFFTGRPIDNPWEQSKAPSTRKKDSDTMPATKLSEAGVPLSAAQIDHLVRGYLGYAGASVFSMLDGYARPLADMPSKPDRELRDMPVVGRFTDDLAIPNGSSRYLTEFYDQMNDLRKIEEERKALEASADWDELAVFEDVHADDLGKYEEMEGLREEMADLNKEVKEIRQSRDYSPAEKRALITGIHRQKEDVARSIK